MSNHILKDFVFSSCFIAFSFGLMACDQETRASQADKKTLDDTSSVKPKVIAGGDMANVLSKTHWQLQKIYIEKDKPQLLLPDTSYTLFFDSVEARAKGKVDCNHYFASYTFDAKKSEVKLEDISTTEMLCMMYNNNDYPALAYQKQTNIYRSGLAGRSRLELKDNTLIWHSENGMQLIFEPIQLVK